MHLLCDPHTHTLFSRHAYSTLEENVRAAAARGLELLGTTEHYSKMLWPEGDPRNFQYYMNFGVWPREVDGVYLAHGAEADIVDLEGRLFGHDILVDHHFSGRAFEKPRTLKDIVFKDCDYVIASVHDKTFTKGSTQAQMTQAYLGTLDDPKVFILGHIGRTGLDIDVEEILLRARELGKCIEINEHSLMGDYGKSPTRCRPPTPISPMTWAGSTPSRACLRRSISPRSLSSRAAARRSSVRSPIWGILPEVELGGTPPNDVGNRG